MGEWMDDYELCANLRLLADVHTQTVLRFAVRLYALSGGDEEKLAALKVLSRTNFLVSKWYRIPERYVLVAPTGQEFAGAALIDQLRGQHYWEDAVDDAWKQIAPFRITSEDDFEDHRLPLPNPMLRIETVLFEFPDGRVMFPPQNEAGVTIMTM